MQITDNTLRGGSGIGFLNGISRASGNRMLDLTIARNTIEDNPGPSSHGGPWAAGIWIFAGAFDGGGSRLGLVHGVSLVHNRITIRGGTQVFAGILIAGGKGATTGNNSVTCIHLRGNTVTGAKPAILVAATITDRGLVPGTNKATLGGC
ncbi:MAG: hypothetical protein ACXVRA_06170 [Gaiellaceae bacterium]